MRLPSALALRAARRLPPNLKRLVNAARGIEMPSVVDRPSGRSVIVLAPHPDDELIGCGGTMQKHLEAGERVDVVFMTSGERTASFVGRDASEAARQREAEATDACAAIGLGPDRLHFLRLPDGDVGPAHAGALEATLASIGADLVYAPNPVDAHRDHVATTRLLGDVLGAVSTVRYVALYEVWTPVHPTVVVDVSTQLEAKLAALARYVSALEVVDYAHTARGLAAYRAGHGLHGRGYAEAFTLLAREPFVTLLATLGG